MSTVLEFFGEPFDAVSWLTADTVPTTSRPDISPQTRIENGSLFGRLRAALAAAHDSALRAQAALQLRQLARHNTPNLRQVPIQAAEEGAFKPLARSTVTTLSPSELARLVAGDIAGVFGSNYDQDDCNPDIRLAAGKELVLTEITEIRRSGGGRIVAHRVPGADPVEATAQAAQVFALYSGLHLCLADATFVRIDEHRTRVEARADEISTEMDVEIEQIGLLPRPWLLVRARIGTALVTNVALALQEKPGVPVGPERGGRPARWLGRKSSRGERTLLNELHIAHITEGDQGIAFGPEFSRYTGRRATRLPSGGLTLVDRLVTLQGERGKLDAASYLTEYDSPSDSWYYSDTANASMPNVIYMEMSLQAALIFGYYLGPTLSTPDKTLSLRNLGGRATVLREVDLRDTTIRQHTELTSTSPIPGSTLQTFTYTLSVHDEPFYAGETMFGYFSDQALENQAGLDAGRSVPTWLEAERPTTGVHTIDVAARRADQTAPSLSRDHLALLDQVTVVDGGGRYGLGYLHAQRRIDPDDWFFARHFRFDPVIPGSIGVESVIQAMQEWLLDSGLGDHLRAPGFILPVGVPFTWKYRGQFLSTDGMSTLEVHVKQIETRPGRVRVVADASMWKPGLRVYELTDIAIELRESGAESW